MSSFESRGRRVLVFCASSGRCDAVFHAAAALGRAIARAGHTLVYGGGAVGSMGALADAALAEGGSVVGIIPRFMHDVHLGMWQSVATIDEVLPAIEQAADWPADAARFATR